MITLCKIVYLHGINLEIIFWKVLQVDNIRYLYFIIGLKLKNNLNIRRGLS